jgi:DNA-binding transcriptional ArsR family regulator
MNQSDVLGTLSALAQKSRLAVFRLLVKRGPEGYAAGEIGERLAIPGPTLSFHLKELARTGLVAPQPDGRFIWYRANLATMNGLVAYLTENCCRSQAKAACCGPLTPKPRIVARTRLENLA